MKKGFYTQAVLRHGLCSHNNLLCLLYTTNKNWNFRKKQRFLMQFEPYATWALKQVIMATFVDSQMHGKP